MIKGLLYEKRCMVYPSFKCNECTRSLLENTGKIVQKKERKKYYIKDISVIEVPLTAELNTLMPNFKSIGLVNENFAAELFLELDLFNGAFPYEKYKKSWNAGFQTDNSWSKKEFSPDINCSGRVDIGDIRTNWELNRHYQFAALAKNYYMTGSEAYLEELNFLFYDWNKHNLFMQGIEWTSAMEMAIRVNSWIFTCCFLDKASKKHCNDKCKSLISDMSHGILVMVNYVIEHLSKFSSANNHLIVELYAVTLAGIFYGYKPWQEFGIEKMTEELVRQNYQDGVNKEMSLHYQTFVMEAYGILMVILKKNKKTIPEVWKEYLIKMSEFVSDCCGDYGETIVFGDNDEGKILDLSGKYFNYYHYILDLMSCVLTQRYTELDNIHENIGWLFHKEEIDRNKVKKDILRLLPNVIEPGAILLFAVQTGNYCLV